MVPPFRAAVLVATAVALSLAFTAPAAAAGPGASAVRGCHVSHAPSAYGTTYLFSLRVSGTSCASGRRLVRAFNRCRHRHGKAGRCGRALGYRCTEHRFARIATQYDSRVRCRRGRRVVSFTYEQFT